jgi:protein SCO1/2
MSAPASLKFSLIDDRGRAVDESAALGALSLFFFGFTNCRMVCPRALGKLSASLAELGSDGDDIRAFYVTVDPDRDSPEVMRAFLQQGYPRFSGLTGDPDRLREFQQSLHVHARRRDDPKEPDGYAMPHSAFTYVFDAEGDYLAHFGDGMPAPETTARLRQLATATMSQGDEP